MNNNPVFNYYGSYNHITEDCIICAVDKDRDKNRFMGPVLIWPNITVVENIVFQEILALTRVRNIVNSKSLIVHIEI